MRRHHKFVGNEVSLVQMQNNVTLLKKELEQAEKKKQDLRSDDLFLMNPQLIQQIEETKIVTTITEKHVENLIDL